ncbi:Aminoglycoside phosphotransferase [Penicillium pulvis]|uniref:Aminoglycoside phosphotransferase n=1 Tax=Penicillium pulvis TaxID=1562058 RepID=UPI002548CB91|nr:Aminoglycoside phosphotransferase [Penicillium pulvis]KAJ5813305.1 Aminoglycoside phosphotransferase [Penicillium pulvis]
MHLSNVATRPTIISSGGSNMATPHNSRTVDVDEYQKLNNILSLLFPSTVHVQQSQNINARVHTLRLLTLSNGGRLLLKGSPLPGTPSYDTNAFSLRPKPVSWYSWARVPILAFRNSIIMTREGPFSAPPI